MIPKWLAAGLIGAGILSMGSAATRRRAPGQGILVAPGVRYQATDEDWLWLARACLGETGDHAGRVAVAWSIVQRFVAFKQRNGPFATFTSLIRAFSQPVNPIWSTLSACTSDGRGCCGNTTRCSARNLSRRAGYQSRSWAWFEENEPALYRMIRSFAEARPPANPVQGYTNFAACSHTTGYNVAGNCFSHFPPLEGVVTIE